MNTLDFEMSDPVDRRKYRQARLQPAKRTYHPPLLTRYGEVRHLTQGGSPGSGDSGTGVTIQNPPMGSVQPPNNRRV